MAANLNLDCAKANPFRATQLWNDLIQHLQENVKVKRRRNLMKVYEECFTGANAVDVLYEFVQLHPNEFAKTASVPREKIIRLCQSFIDNGILEQTSVTKDSEKYVKFSDSTFSFYQFVDKKLCNNNNTLEMKFSDERRVLQDLNANNSSDGECKLEKAHHLKSISLPNLKPISRSRFSSFTGLSVLSLKLSLRNSLNNNESDEADTDKRVGRTLKRSANSEHAMKRSSSESSTTVSSTSTLASDNNVRKDVKLDGVNKRERMRFSPRLSLRRKTAKRSVKSSPSNGESVAMKHTACENHQCLNNKEDRNIKRKLTTEELSNLKSECVRVRLLQILDLPFVDTVTASNTVHKKHNHGVDQTVHPCNSTSISSSEVEAAYLSEDSWISSAVSVVRRIPNGNDILRQHAHNQPYMKKLKLFYAISDYYKTLSTSLFEESSAELLDTFVQMLAMKPVSECVEALQLFIHLLPDSRIYELCDLFNFLYHVISDADVCITLQFSNKTLVIRHFLSAIFPSVEKEKYSEKRRDMTDLMLFIMEQRDEAFQLPSSVKATMKRKQKLLEAGQLDKSAVEPDSTFCTKISSEEYDKQRIEFTQMQVAQLAKHLHSDNTVLPKKKKDLLKRLQSTHSSVYDRSVGPMKATIGPMKATPGPMKATFAASAGDHQAIVKGPLSDPLHRRRNKSRKNLR